MLPHTRDDTFYFSLITFEVEGVLFRVPRQLFESESDVFKDMFSLPTTTETEEGTSDEKPLILPEVSSKTFRAILRILLHSCFELEGELGSEDVSSVLKFLHAWNFSQAFALAVEQADECDIDPVERITMAESYGISDWLHQAYYELAMRLKPPTPEEVNKLGVDNTLKLVDARERRYRWIIENDHIAASRSQPRGDSAFSGNYERRSRLLNPNFEGSKGDVFIERHKAAVHAIVTEVFGFTE